MIISEVIINIWSELILKFALTKKSRDRSANNMVLAFQGFYKLGNNRKKGKTSFRKQNINFIFSLKNLLKK